MKTQLRVVVLLVGLFSLFPSFGMAQSSFSTFWNSREQLLTGQPLFDEGVRSALHSEFGPGIFVDISGSFGIPGDRSGRDLNFGGGIQSRRARVGFGYQNFRPILKIPAGGDFWQAYAELTSHGRDVTSQPVGFFLRGGYLHLRENSDLSALYGAGGVRHNLPILPGVKIRQGALASFDSGFLGYEKGLIGRYSADLHLELGENITLVPLGFAYWKPLIDASDRQRGRQWSVGLILHTDRNGGWYTASMPFGDR